MVPLQIQWKGEQHKHGDPGHHNALWICPRPTVSEDGELSYWNSNVLVLISLLTQLNVSSQLQQAELVDSVEQADGRVLVYVKQVRGISPEEQHVVSRMSLTVCLLNTVVKGHSGELRAGAHTGGPSPEPAASCGQDLRLLRAK